MKWKYKKKFINYFCSIPPLQLKKIFFFFIFILSFAISTLAQEKDSVEKQTKLLMLGINVSQAITGDLELHVKYKFHPRHALTIAAGYDLNFSDPGKKCDPDKLYSGYGSGEYTKQWATYFYGNGPAGRLIYDFIYDFTDKWEKFISISAIAKSRTYDDYLFFPNHGYAAVCESGRQSILGICGYQGAERKWKLISIRFYWGAGLRFVWNDVHWEKQELYSYEPEKEDFTRKLIVPSIDGGIIFYFKTSGN